MSEIELEPCPFGADHRVWIGVADDEGNYFGELGCDYEREPWSGIAYALFHEGWGDCPLCTDGDDSAMGGMLFDTPEEAAEAWNRRAERTCKPLPLTFLDMQTEHIAKLHLATGMVSERVPYKRCSRCGGRFPEKSRYCPDCGAKVETVE